MKCMLKDIRESKGMSITELSELSGVSRPTIYSIENGEGSTIRTLTALANALNVSINEFFLPSMLSDVNTSEVTT